MTNSTTNNQFNIKGDFKGNVGPNGVVNNGTSPGVADVLAALDTLLRETDPQIEQHKAIRASVRDVQTSIEKGEAPKVDKLEQAVKAATFAEKSTKAIHTAVGLVVDYVIRDGGNSGP